MKIVQLSAGFQSLLPLCTSKLGPSDADSQVGGFVYILNPVGLSNELSCETGSFSHCRLNPHRFFQSEVLRLYFPSLEPWVARSVSLPSCSSQFICTQMWDHPFCQPLPHLPQSSSYHLAVSPLHPAAHSAPPSGLDACFFFNSLVVGFPYSLIFCQCWLFFVFKFVVVLLLVVQGGTLCLPTPPSWLEVGSVLSFGPFLCLSSPVML